jgi:hypothetical protein
VITYYLSVQGNLSVRIPLAAGKEK